MIGFQAPLWLLLLGLIPLIRWLHRFNLQSTTLPSTTLFLWSGLQRRSSSDGSPGKPDPRWVLRALISSLLILALAKPQLQGTHEPPLEVWVDDSLSMFTLEQGHSRLQAGLLQLQSYLGEHKFSRIQLHSLGDPAEVLSLDPEDTSAWDNQLNPWSSHPRAEPLPPPLVTLSAQASHVLITDGADRSLNRWAGSAPLRHVIRSGNLRQNLALSRLSLRESLTDSGLIAGSARIDNLGDSGQSLRLVISQQESIIKTLELEIPPLASRSTTFSIAPDSKGSLEAQLQSSDDPLPLDDSLELDLADLRSPLGYSVLGDCERSFIAAIDSHPALVRMNAGADVLINCSAEAQNSTLPELVLHPVSNLRRTTQSAHWHQSLSTDYLPLTAGVAYSNAAPTLASANTPILSANGRMLILQRPGTDKVIDCYIDTGDAAFSREAQYPLLMLALISRLSGRNLETVPLTIDRDPQASRITPIAFPVGAASRASPRPAVILLTTPILFAIFLLLVTDAVLGRFTAPGKLNWQA
jgi:hypothetical protein